tara:strand:- start:448 stop:627 length:180 start_codon:yes stop_codon:yes gene_type:complete
MKKRKLPVTDVRPYTERIKELERTTQDMEVLIAILWEFVSEKDVDEITKLLKEHEDTMG